MSTKEQLVHATSSLLEAQGYHATSLSQILCESGTPKGSLYYHFPDGKDGLAAAAIEYTGRALADHIKRSLAQHAAPAVALRSFVEHIAFHVERSEFHSGGPLTTVALETATTNPRLNLMCRAAYAQVHDVFVHWLQQHGYTPARAHCLAVTITAAIEGGTLLARTHHSAEPLRQVAQELERLLQI